MAGRRKFWGWGVEGGGPGPAEIDAVVERLGAAFGAPPSDRIEPPRAADLELPAPRIAAPAALAALLGDDPADRAGHHYGKSFRDVVRGLANHFPAPPDWVARPATEADVAALLEWCRTARIAVVPYGGGSSVVGGVETGVAGDYAGVVSLDLGRLGRVLEVDATSRAARVQAGVVGPSLEHQLRPSGLTLRHYPQSFEHSTLGGWIATRSAGHFATLHTRIDDFVESLRTVTPGGVMQSRRLPASGAGPSPDRLVLGSEGTLGVITEAWVRLQPRPVHRCAASVAFPGGFGAGATAVRALAQSGLYPANCRLLDPLEAMISGSGGGAVLLVAFESADHPQEARLERALEICRNAGGEPEPSGEPTAGRWREAFFQAPYLRDELVARSVVVETFETAVTWDRFDDFHDRVVTATLAAAREVCGGGLVAARLTHAYPDGAAPYYPVMAPGRPGAELGQWDQIKAAASEAILAAGGTITHHHAVGRDHRPWYDRQRPDPFAGALRAVKAELDPSGILNPGVLVDP